MRRLFLAAALLLLPGAAMAQEAAGLPADPVIEEVGKSLSPDGIRERQLLAIKALADAYEAEKAKRAAAEEKLRHPGPRWPRWNFE